MKYCKKCKHFVPKREKEDEYYLREHCNVLFVKVSYRGAGDWQEASPRWKEIMKYYKKTTSWLERFGNSTFYGAPEQIKFNFILNRSGDCKFHEEKKK